MKVLWRSRAARSLIAWLAVGYVELLTATVRWRVVGREVIEAGLASAEGAVVLFWHGRIALGLACRPLLGARARRVLISQSRDGSLIALAAERLGVLPIRGSAAGEPGVMAKGGAGAFREALAFVAEGGVMILTPDGPRGPREALPTGPVRLARAAGRPVFLMSLAARPAWSLKSWDRMRLPLPFARGRVVVEGPLRIGSGADEAAVEAARADWQGRMRAGQARAEALLADRAG